MELFLPIILAVVALGLTFAMFATRILLVKDGQFAGTCSSNNLLLKDELGACTVCGASPDEICQNDEAVA